MAKKGRAALKAYFETNDFPTQAEFAELIDSFINLVDQSTIDATIIVNVPILGTGQGGKILKKGNAVLQMGEFSDNDTAISSDDGGFASGGSFYIGSSFAGISFGPIQVFYAETNKTKIALDADNYIEIIYTGITHEINIVSQNHVKINAPNTHVGTIGQKVGFLGAGPITRPTITGSKAGNVALSNLLTELENLGLITNNTT